MTSPVRDADQGMIDPLPGLTLAERRLMDELAGTNESLRALLERLNGFSAEVVRQRLATPGIVLPDPSQPQQTVEFLPNQAQPIAIDKFGRIRTATFRCLLDSFPSFVIPAGQKASQWVNCDLTGLNSIVGLVLYDARGRLGTEVITVEGSPWRSEPDPSVPSADGWTMQANIFGATLGTVSVVSGASVYQRWLRLVSSNAVSQTLTFIAVGTW